MAGKTINGVQQVGGVVALNPSTGAILAMASYPSYDPNQLSVLNTRHAGNVVSQLTKENPSPLINNATQTTLPPGSTFKIVTSSAWYTQNTTLNPHTTVYSPQPLKLPNGNFLNDDNDDAVRQRVRPHAGDHGVRPVLQHPVRQHRHQPRRPDDRRDGRQVRLQQGRSTSPA